MVGKNPGSDAAFIAINATGGDGIVPVFSPNGGVNLIRGLCGNDVADKIGDAFAEISQ